MPVGLEYAIGPLSEIPPGEGRNFDVDGELISIFRTRTDSVFAVQAACPHKGGPLADGLVGGTTLICPLHGWKFNLADGKALLGDCALRTYPVRVDESNCIQLTQT